MSLSDYLKPITTRIWRICPPRLPCSPLTTTQLGSQFDQGNHLTEFVAQPPISLSRHEGSPRDAHARSSMRSPSANKFLRTYGRAASPGASSRRLQMTK